MNTPLRIAYFGSGTFAIAPLDALLNRPEDYDVVAVICQPDRTVGRQKQLEACPIGQAASHGTFELIKPASVRGNDQFAETLKNLNLDLAIVASYGQILPKNILEIPKLGFLNLHGSILPAWRGASPIQSAILADNKKTGVSLMVMDEKMDHGPVLKTSELELAPHDTHKSLELRLSRLAADLAVDSVKQYALGGLQAKEQDHEQATFCKILKRDNGLISWKEEKASEIERKLRAYTPWPGIFTVWNNNGQSIRIKLLRVRIEPETQDLPPGTVIESEDGRPAAVTADGNLIVFLECQMEGKKACSGRAVACGYQKLIGSVLES